MRRVMVALALAPASEQGDGTNSRASSTGSRNREFCGFRRFAAGFWTVTGKPSIFVAYASAWRTGFS